MKTNTLFSILIVATLYSCSSEFYQAYKLDSTEVVFKDKKFIFENDEILISYNFWSNGINKPYTIYNKTDSIIFLDMENSHYAINGKGNSYYRNRVLTSQNTTGSETAINWASKYFNTPLIETSSVKSSNTNGVYIFEPTIVRIYPKTFVDIWGLNFIPVQFLSCDLKPASANSSKSTLVIQRDKTPISIVNSLKYGFSLKQEKNHTIVNNFWVSEVTNYDPFDFVGTFKINYCESSEWKEIFRYESANSFYSKIIIQP
ncbi:MAG: hypothetical protein V4613_02800 [Bacteroidota bacterium]